MSETPAGYLTVRDAAQALDRSAEQVRRYLREGRLEGQRLGGQWFIRETAVLYRTKRGETNVDRLGASGMASDGREEREMAMRAEIVDRIKSRREVIKGRWERTGIAVDVPEVIRDLREER